MWCLRSFKRLSRHCNVFVCIVVLLITVFSLGLAETAGETIFSVHAASFKDLNNAEQYMKSIRNKDCEPFYREVTIPEKGTWFRVLTGRHKTREEAKLYGKNLRKQGIIKTVTIRELDIGEDKEQEVQQPVMVSAPLDEKLEVKPENETYTPEKNIRAENIPAAEKSDIQQLPLFLAEALEEFDRGNIEKAAAKLLEIEKNKQLTDEQKKTVLRYLADSYFLLGQERDKKKLLKAAEYYRNILLAYPGQGQENVLTMYRLAKSYEEMKLSYEALREYNKFLEQYPDSIYAADALFSVGTISFEINRNNEAIDHFKMYIQRFPEGEKVRSAFFSIGDCYIMNKQFKEAEFWYKEALTRWPVIEEMPKNILLKAGLFYFQIEEYSEALKMLLAYANLYPDDDHSKEALYKSAQSYIQMKNPSLGLTLLSLLIEKYPESEEARDGAVIMANMGTENPHLDVAVNIFSNLENYKNPIETYDDIALRAVYAESKEAMLFQKGHAFLIKGRDQKAFDTFKSLLEVYGYGKYREKAEEYLAKSTDGLIGRYYIDKDFLAIVDIYFKSRKHGIMKHGNRDSLRKIGESLEMVGLSKYAVSFFQTLIEIDENAGQRDAEAFLSLARSLYQEGNTEDAAKTLKELLSMDIGEKEDKIDFQAKTMTAAIYDERGEFEKSAALYSELVVSCLNNSDKTLYFKKFGNSLEMLGHNVSAITNYTKAMNLCKEGKTYCKSEFVAHVNESIGDCLYKIGKYDRAISIYEKNLNSASSNWTRYYLGCGYINIGELGSAEQIFSSLTDGKSEGFWTGIIDYHIDDKAWTDRYKDYL